jgi:leucyl aminopeptidase
MNFELKSLDWHAAAKVKTDALVVLVPAHYQPTQGAATNALDALLATALKAGDFETSTEKLLQTYRAAGVAAPRLIFAGVGKAAPRDVRKAVLAAVAAFKPAKDAKSVSLTLCTSAMADLSGDALAAAINAVADASYRYTTTKSKPEPRKINQVTVGVAQPKNLKDAFAHATACVQGVEFAKEWANRPANHATPTMLGEAAQSIAKGVKGMTCEVLGPKEVAKLGMGSFMAVSQGSEQPLRFIVLRYNGHSSGAKAQAPTVLVGKGITFDTGGISIKPAAEMDEMKFDMGGAASVLGVFKALAQLQPKINVVGLIPSCENMPDGRAVKPGDVVTSMSGQTIEILNTDAEGRLILCDALTYAERFKPRAVVDIATLTGACVVALGHIRSGLFSTNDALAQALHAAGEASLDTCWRMPLDDEYAEGLKSNFADVANIAGRAGGCITAAKFLQRFSDKFAWAHLDIAGTAWKSGAAKGSTGRPVNLLMKYLVSPVK